MKRVHKNETPQFRDKEALLVNVPELQLNLKNKCILSKINLQLFWSYVKKHYARLPTR